MSTAIRIEAKGSAPLMIICRNPIPPIRVEEMKREIEAALEAGKGLIVESDLSAYQLVRGRWELLS